MNTTTAAIATGVVVAAGRWSQEKPVDIKIAVGAGVFALSLSLISSADEKIANQFAFMVLFLALIMYLPTLMTKLGWSGATKQAISPGTTRAPGTRG